MSIEITKIDKENTEKEQVTTVNGEKPWHAASRNNKETRNLTGKERAYVQYRIENPLSTKAEAVKAVYDVKPDVKTKTLENMASTIEKRPPVLAILTNHAERAEELLTELMETTVKFSTTGSKEGAQYAGVAERTLNSVLDRVHGKAKQSIDITSKSVSINVDLTQSTNE